MSVPERNLRIIPLPRLSEPREPLSVGHLSPASLNRSSAEGFVRDLFAQHYTARLSSFYPHLFTITNTAEEFIAVTGIRLAEDEQLFSEHYLDATIEHSIEQFGMPSVARSDIIEIGNLAPASVGHARWLIAALTAWVHAAGFRKVVFTVAPMLRNTFQRMGLETQCIAHADINRIDAATRQNWGNYYESQPSVYVGDIHNAYTILSSRLDNTMPRLKQLWDDAHRSGATFAVRRHTDQVTMQQQK